MRKGAKYIRVVAVPPPDNSTLGMTKVDSVLRTIDLKLISCYSTNVTNCIGWVLCRCDPVSDIAGERLSDVRTVQILGKDGVEFLSLPPLY